MFADFVFDSIFEGTDARDLVLSFARGDVTINTGAGDDEFRDFASSNTTIDTGSGNDEILAGGGDDIISAGSGRDFIDGGIGNDVIDAGSGFDAVFGGAGDDTFRITSTDSFTFTQILDFSGGDTLVLENQGVSSFADLDTNNDGVLNNADENVLAQEGASFLEIFLDNGVGLLVHAELDEGVLPELTEDNVLFA